MLVSDGRIAPGSVLTDSKRRCKATVRVDGSLDCDGQPAGSIHKVGAGVQSAPSCNGWTFWHVDDGKELRVIDAVRQDWLLAHEASGITSSRRKLGSLSFSHDASDPSFRWDDVHEERACSHRCPDPISAPPRPMRPSLAAP